MHEFCVSLTLLLLRGCFGVLIALLLFVYGDAGMHAVFAVSQITHRQSYRYICVVCALDPIYNNEFVGYALCVAGVCVCVQHEHVSVRCSFAVHR